MDFGWQNPGREGMFQELMSVIPSTPAKILGTNDDFGSIVIVDEALKGPMEFQYQPIVLYNMR
jgi:hypothetical protein